MAQKRSALMNRQASGDRSASSWVMRHSSHRSSSCWTGPSRNACSFADSSASGRRSSRRQSGAPENISPSHQTVPASSAVRSVADSVGSTRANRSSAGRVIQRRRIAVTFRGTTIAANSSHRNRPGPRPVLVSVHTSSRAAITPVAVPRRTRCQASARKAARKTTNQNSAAMAAPRPQARPGEGDTATIGKRLLPRNRGGRPVRPGASRRKSPG